MTRHDVPIADAYIKGAVNSGIKFKMEFEGWEAAVAAGATLDELYKWYDGKYDRMFKAHVIQWHRDHKLIKAHEQDATRPKKKR